MCNHLQDYEPDYEKMWTSGWSCCMQVVWCVLVALVVTYHRALKLLEPGLFKSGLATWFYSQMLRGDGDDEVVIFEKL